MPYTIAILSKFPPLEGGIAAKTYWLARGLAARGHEVHVITDTLGAGKEYEIPDIGDHLAGIPNLWVHRPQQEMPWHIPESDERALALLDLATKVVREHNVDLLDTGYLVPYGVVGHLTKMLTGVPHVLRHGSSDIEKCLKQGVIGALLHEAISRADIVVTNHSNESLLQPIASRLVCQPPYVPDESAFRSIGRDAPLWRVASIGKINYHWQHKGWHRIADIMRHLTGRFECWIVGQGKGMDDFQAGLGEELAHAIAWRQFVSPWEMPRLLNELDAVFIFESDLPHAVMSNIALEAVCCGTGIITDRPDFAQSHQDLVAVDDRRVLVVQPSQPASAAGMIAQWLSESAGSRQPSHQYVKYEDYVSANETIYEGLVKSGIAQ